MSFTRSLACVAGVLAVVSLAPAQTFVEPLEDLTYDAEGNAYGGSQRVWKTICGSPDGALTVEELETIAMKHRQIVANDDFTAVTAAGVGVDMSTAAVAGPAVTFNTFGVPAAAQTALVTVAAKIADTFGDPVSFSVQVTWANLGGGTLGATSSSTANRPYTVTRQQLTADMDSNDSIQTSLPGLTLPVRYNASSTTVTNEDTIRVTWANIKAIGGSTSSTVATMTINSTVSWDYDPSNGVGGNFDFQSVMIHEVTHAMGFTSAVDNAGNDTEMMDIWRFQLSDSGNDYNPDTLAEFGTTPRVNDNNNPNDGHQFDLINVEYRMEDGNPSQASHTRQANGYGIMSPGIGGGQSFYPDFWQQADLDILDAIGWDYPAEAQVTTIPFFDDIPDTVLDNGLWSGVVGAVGSTRGIDEPSPPYSMNLDGVLDGDPEQARSAIMNTTGVSDLRLAYYFQRTGVDDSPEAGDDLVVEFLNSSGSWLEINRHPGAGPDMTEFLPVTILLPPGAQHSTFRIRFRSESDGESNGSDDWFIDDVRIGVGCDGGDKDCSGGQVCDPDLVFCVDPTVDPCPEDLDGNSDVGFTDLVLLLSAWGPCPACPEDIDGNNDVGFTDLVLLLSVWGPCS